MKKENFNTMENTVFYIDATNDELTNKVERAHCDVLSRQAIITYMVNSGSVNDPSMLGTFNKYHDEYTKKFIEYDQAKREMEEYYNLSSYGNQILWNIDFAAKKIEVTVLA